jgi:hypothetical protein
MLHDYSLEYQGYTGRKTEKVAPIKAQEIVRNLKRFPDDFMFQFTEKHLPAVLAGSLT